MDKSIIKKLLREELLDEEISAGSFIVYHRTSTTNPENFNKGYKTGYGAMYGAGLYTTYELAQQLEPSMVSTYGNTIVEFKIQNNNKFIILDYPEAKKVYGQKYTLMDQLKKVMGGYFNKFFNNHRTDLINFNDELNTQENTRTSRIAEKLSAIRDFITHVDGVIFTGQNDGNVLVLYNTNLANPLRYSLDNAETWNNLKTAASHGIGRDTRSGNKMINNLTITSSNISGQEVLKLFKQQPEIISHLDDGDVLALFDKFNNPMVVYDYLLNSPNLPPTLSATIIRSMSQKLPMETVISYFISRPKLFEENQRDILYYIRQLGDSYNVLIKLFSSKIVFTDYGLAVIVDGVLKTISDDKKYDLMIGFLAHSKDVYTSTITKFLENVENPILLINKIVENNNAFKNTGKYNFKTIIEELSTTYPNIYLELIKNPKLINSFDYFDMFNFIEKSPNYDDLVISLLTNPIFLNNPDIDSYRISWFIKEAKNKDKVLKILAKSMRFMNKIEGWELQRLILSTTDQLGVVKELMKNKNFHNKMEYRFGELIDSAANPEAMTQLLTPYLQENKKGLKNIIREALDKTITCKKCGWHWKESESDKKDLYICHKCGYDNTPKKESLNERILTKKEKDIKVMAAFVNFAKKELGIDDGIKVALAYERTPDIKTTAYYNLDGFVKIYVKDRAIIDVCRSIAHELVHHKQNIEGRLKDATKDGEDGSDIENEANAVAGVIIRKWGKLYPDLYE